MVGWDRVVWFAVQDELDSYGFGGTEASLDVSVGWPRKPLFFLGKVWFAVSWGHKPAVSTSKRCIFCWPFWILLRRSCLLNWAMYKGSRTLWLCFVLVTYKYWLHYAYMYLFFQVCLCSVRIYTHFLCICICSYRSILYLSKSVNVPLFDILWRVEPRSPRIVFLKHGGPNGIITWRTNTLYRSIMFMCVY